MRSFQFMFVCMLLASSVAATEPSMSVRVEICEDGLADKDAWPAEAPQASLSNERDRPSLTVPRLRAVSDVMSALGWRGARQDPTSTRETSPNALQPAIIANSVMSVWLTRLSDDHGLTELALREQTVEALVDELFLRLLSRKPMERERERYIPWLADGFDDRRIVSAQVDAGRLSRGSRGSLEACQPNLHAELRS